MNKSLLLIIVAFIAINTNAQFKDPEQKIMNAEARKGVEGSFIKLSDGITHYEKVGIAKNGVVLLVHGFSVPYYIWDGFFENLVNVGFQVIRYDLYGRGYSDRLNKEYTTTVYSQQIFDLIKGLSIKTPVYLMGVSFGGIVSANFTLTYPALVKKLVLIDPAAGKTNITSTEQALDEMMAINSEKRALGQLDDFKYPANFPNWVSRYKVQMQYKGTRKALVSTLFHYDTIPNLDRYKSLQNLQKSTLLIWGTEDHAVPYNYSDSIRSVLNVQFLSVSDAGHLPYLEKPTLVNKKVVSFLKEN